MTLMHIGIWLLFSSLNLFIARHAIRELREGDGPFDGSASADIFTAVQVLFGPVGTFILLREWYISLKATRRVLAALNKIIVSRGGKKQYSLRRAFSTLESFPPDVLEQAHKEMTPEFGIQLEASKRFLVWQAAYESWERDIKAGVTSKPFSPPLYIKNPSAFVFIVKNDEIPPSPEELSYRCDSEFERLISEYKRNKGIL